MRDRRRGTGQVAVLVEVEHLAALAGVGAGSFVAAAGAIAAWLLAAAAKAELRNECPLNVVTAEGAHWLRAVMLAQHGPE